MPTYNQEGSNGGMTLGQKESATIMTRGTSEKNGSPKKAIRQPWAKSGKQKKTWKFSKGLKKRSPKPAGRV